MDLALTDDQEALRSAFAAFLAKESTPERVRTAEPLGFDARLWQQVTGLGMVSMGLPAPHGDGAGLLDLALMAEEVGRRVSPVPLVEVLVASRLLARCGGRPAERWIGPAADGSAVVTAALHPPRDGMLKLVPAGAICDAVVFLDGGELVVTGPHHPMTAPMNHGCAPLADRPTTTGERHVLARGDDARAAHAAALVEWKVLTAAALVGVGATGLELGVDYAKQRIAFDVPIGSFQGVAHPLADAATAIDGAQLLARKAAWAVDEGLPEANVLASMAFVFAAESAMQSTAAGLHVHGGYGFMLEYDIQLFFRRAKAWASVYDDPRREYQRIADLLYGPVGTSKA